jgi:hypothetical protein
MTPRDKDDVWGGVEQDELGPRAITDTSTRVRQAPASRAGAAQARGPALAGTLILVLLCGVCLGLAYQSGAYAARTWLPLLMAVAALAVVMCVAGPPVSSGRFQKILLALFALQAVWTAASILWADSQANAWVEINRTLFFVVTVALAFAAVRWAGRTGLKALALLVLGVTALVAFETAIGLAADNTPLHFFAGGRLNHPITYFNALACLWMMGFWLALGTAGGAQRGEDRPPSGRITIIRSGTGDFPRWTQPVLLVLAVFLAEMALLPQSRGALWAFLLTLPFFVILSPNRFRALVDLVMVVVPVVLFWDRLTAVRAAANTPGGPLRPALTGALEAIGYSICIVLGAWAVTYVVERLLAPLSRRAVKWIGIALVVLALGGVTGGLLYADHRTGGLGSYLDDRVQDVLNDSDTGGSGSRFSAMSLNGRWIQWKVAAQAFREHPLLGVGAQNFEIYHYQHRTILLEVKQPHSQPMQLLAELGLPGLLLWVAFFLGTMVYAVRTRFRRVGRAHQAVIASIMTAVISWFIHSSADWIWQVAATTLPAMMLLGGLVGAGERAAPEPAKAASPAPSPRLRRVGLTRPLAVVLALVVIVSAALPYLALMYCDMAVSAKTVDKVTARTETAAKIDPTSVMPFVVRADFHRLAAQSAPEDSAERLAQFKEEAAAWIEAIAREPRAWLYHFNAAEAFVHARETALKVSPASADILGEQARAYLAKARRLNPLCPQVTALEQGL